jgi:hypothetical protein
MPLLCFLFQVVEGTGFEPVKHLVRQIYSLFRLTAPAPLQDAQVRQSPRGDSNPLTYRLQVGCATVAPLGHEPLCATAFYYM